VSGRRRLAQPPTLLRRGAALEDLISA